MTHSSLTRVLGAIVAVTALAIFTVGVALPAVHVDPWILLGVFGLAAGGFSIFLMGLILVSFVIEDRLDRHRRRAQADVLVRAEDLVARTEPLPRVEEPTELQPDNVVQIRSHATVPALRVIHTETSSWQPEPWTVDRWLHDGPRRGDVA